MGVKALKPSRVKVLNWGKLKASQEVEAALAPPLDSAHNYAYVSCQEELEP